MAILASQQWWIRTDGNELNGGGFDSTISGAGTNYSDQAAAQLSLTDVVTVGTGAVTSVTGGFTSQMIGNVIRIAGDGYYVVTSQTNTNTIGVDRNTGTATGQSARIGGAWALLRSAASNQQNTAPILPTPVAAGHTVNIRGTGNLDGSADYTEDGWLIFPGGDDTIGRVHFLGYNGRPCLTNTGSHITTFQAIRHNWEHIKFIDSGTGINRGYGFLNGYPDSAIMNQVYDCVFDQAGYDVAIVGGADYAYSFDVINCWAKNTGSTAAGTYPAFNSAYFSRIQGNLLTDLRCSEGIKASANAAILDNVVARCTETGIMVALSSAQPAVIVCNNTVDSCGSEGLRLDARLNVASVIATNNNLSNNGGYGLSATSGTATNDLVKGLIDYNNLYNNSSGAYVNISAGAHDTAVNPTYVNSAANDFTPQNVVLKGAAVPQTLGAATNYLWIGAIQAVLALALKRFFLIPN